MSKRTEINDAYKDAMKSKDAVAVATLRLIQAALKDKDIYARGTGNMDGISDAEILSMLQTMIKQRQESATIYHDNNRPELADKENAEIAVIQRFLPAQLDEGAARAAIDGLVNEMGAKDIKDMGKVMAELKNRYAGQLDMARAGGWVKERLSA